MSAQSLRGLPRRADKYVHSNDLHCCRYNYSDMIQRIAIIDFDVHNGNGTATIVRNLRPHAHTRQVWRRTMPDLLIYPESQRERERERERGFADLI